MLGAVERIGVRPAEPRPQEFQQFHFGDQFRLSVFVQFGKPLVEVIGRCHMPHKQIIAYRLCSVNDFLKRLTAKAERRCHQTAADAVKQVYG